MFILPTVFDSMQFSAVINYSEKFSSAQIYWALLEKVSNVLGKCKSEFG